MTLEQSLVRVISRHSDAREAAVVLARLAEHAARTVRSMDAALALGAPDREPFDAIMAEIEAERELATGGDGA